VIDGYADEKPAPPHARLLRASYRQRQSVGTPAPASRTVKRGFSLCDRKIVTISTRRPLLHSGILR